MNTVSSAQSHQLLSTTSFPPIADYGLIGNCHTAALVSRSGSIDWLCLPRFDSPSLFARILDLDRGGAWRIQPTQSFESTHQYRGETNVLETMFTCATGRIVVRDFMDITRHEQLQNRAVPGRLIRIVEAIEGTTEIISVCAPRPDYARALPQFVAIGTAVKFGAFIITAPSPWQIDLSTHTLSCRLTLHAGDRIAFTLATQEESALSEVDPDQALASTIAFWQQWADQCTYQGPYREAVVRSALALRLMTYDPSGAIVAAPTASLPEAIGGKRNWDYRFTWIRDSSFTLYALLMAGYFDSDELYFAWLARTVRVEGTGITILYPITPAGETGEHTLDHLSGYRDSRPVRIGNAAVGQVQLDVYGEVMSALHFAWKAGKYDPTEIWPQVLPMLNWVADHWREPGSGIWEVRGGLRHFVYGKVMLWVALDAGSEIAETLHLPGDVDRWRQERDLIHADVLKNGWSDTLGAFKQSYEDETLDAANLLLPVMGFIEGTDPRMIATIDATIKHLVANGLCYRYRTAPEGVKGEEASFVLCTFWLINALILADRLTEARTWFEQMLAKRSDLGLFAEEIDPVNGEHLGNFPQAFSHIGVINVAVSLAHVGHTGTVQPRHAAAANAAGRGGSGAAAAKQKGSPHPADAE